MLDELRNYFFDKKVLILGFGREGKSTYKLMRDLLPEQVIYIADLNLVEVDDENVKIISGENYLENLDDYDLIVKTPGISLRNVEVAREKITSQTALFLKFFHGKTVGITGTKGKSTTSSLIYAILHEQGVSCRLLGNIGVPVFDYIEEINDETVVVLEMSSYQLEFVRNSPNIAIYLDIFEEHLDFHGSLENYALSKANIFKFQEPEDDFLYGYDNLYLRDLVRREKPKSKQYRVSLEDNQVEIYLANEKVYFGDTEVYNANDARKLPGKYNLSNIMFALGVAKILNLDLAKARETINNFQPLKHRLEYFGEYAGVKYYDNAIATIPEATIVAIVALGDVDTLIIGGKDRGVDFSAFIEYLNNSKIRNVICMPTTGMRIGQKINAEKVHFAKDMREAVRLAKMLTEPGKSCLLSPAAASYDFYKNFEEKGDEFQKLVKS